MLFQFSNIFPLSFNASICFVFLHISLYQIFFGFLFGAIIGSFLNVVIYRLPLMLHDKWTNECQNFLKAKFDIKTNVNQYNELIANGTCRPASILSNKQHKTFNLCFPTSHCPQCKNKIPWQYNIPILGYILLHGKCTACKCKISCIYPIIELLTAICTCWIICNYSFSLKSFLLCVLTYNLIALFFIDLKHYLLPDELTQPMLWLGFLANFNELFTTLNDAVIGALVGYLSLWIINYFFKIWRKKAGMGNGDFKLFAVFGAWLGWQALPILLLIASILGIIGFIVMFICQEQKINIKNHILAFGPCLIIAGWSMFFIPRILC